MRVLRLFLLTAVLCLLVTPVAQAAPIGLLRQYPVPTPASAPRYITNGSDGNLWFTESSEFRPPAIGRITQTGQVTEFPVPCNFCILNDIVQGPHRILYYTSNEAELGRITTGGRVLPPIPMPQSDVLAGSLAVNGNDVWITDFNNNSVWRYDIGTRRFTQFVIPTPAATPYDVAVDAAGIVWFTEFGANRIGRLDPRRGVIAETPTTSSPRGITIATDGQVWFTERFAADAIGRLNPVTGRLTEFPVPGAGPESIAASPDGSLWFTQSFKGNIARITDAGVVTESRPVPGSDPFGVTVDPAGDPWYTMMAANRIGQLRLR